MKAVVCELCGGNEFVKQDGFFVCQHCNTKYTLEEARKLMIEGTVQVTGTVKVDNTDLIENYLSMAQNALDAKNYKEADDYCNKIIEIDLSNYQAWFIKGKAVGWQSTLGSPRITETINAFSKSIENCPKEEKDNLVNEAKDVLFNLHSALFSVRISNFENYPSKADVDGLRNDVFYMINNTFKFLDKSGIFTKTYDAEFASIINVGVVLSWENVKKRFNGDEGKPTDYQLTEFIKESDFLIDALNIAILVCDATFKDEKSNSILTQIYKNLIVLHETVRDAKSYNFNFNYGYKSYYVSKYLTEDAKKLRNEKIEKCKAKISEVELEGKKRAEEAKRKKEEETNRIRDKYWEDHKNEKEKLENEKTSLLSEFNQNKKDIDSLNPQLNEIRDKRIIQTPLETQLYNLNIKIDSLERTKSDLGVFKSKEKKDIEKEIDELIIQKNSLELKAKEERAQYEKSINSEISTLREKTQPLINRNSDISKRVKEINTIIATANGTIDSDGIIIKDELDNEQVACPKCGKFQKKNAFGCIYCHAKF